MKCFFAKKFILLLTIVYSVVMLSACSEKKEPVQHNLPEKHYIKIDGESVERSYIAYFFHISQINMLSEAGLKMNDTSAENLESIQTYWETTKIDGKSAVDVARDIAVDNVVRQKIQYLKALDEKISLSADEEKAIKTQIDSAIENNGGRENFEKQLSDMNTDIESYTQILTENLLIKKLFEKYDSDGRFEAEAGDYAEFESANPDIPPEIMLDSYKKQKFNDMVVTWEKDYKIEINDSKIKEFDI